MRTSFKFFFFFLLVIPFLGSGCSQSVETDKSLIKTWELTSLGDLNSMDIDEMSSLDQDDRFMITFSKNGRFVAKSAVNCYTGAFQISDNSISMIDAEMEESQGKSELPVSLCNLEEKLEYKIIHSWLYISSENAVMLFKPVSQTGTKSRVVVLIAIIVVLFLVSLVLSNSAEHDSRPAEI